MNAPLPCVLVVEDEPQMRRFLRAALEAREMRMIDAATAHQARTQVVAHHPDVVLLDLGLPDLDGIEVMVWLRTWTDVPVIVMSVRDREEDKILALDAGADDYLTKPFGVGELLARIRVALRHAERRQKLLSQPLFRVGDVEVDLERRVVSKGTHPVHLTPTEYKLLTVLVHSQGRVVTHNHLLKQVWGTSFGGDAHYVRVVMVQLRRKLETDPAHPQYLLTEPGVGYRMKEDMAAPPEQKSSA